MPATASEMKAILLEILEMAFQPADVTATQQMGVNMSNAVKRDGVVIIQNQNVEVYARIMPSMVRALRLCDSLGNPYPIIPLQIAEEDKESAHILDKACKWLWEHEYKWEAAQDAFKDHYLGWVVGKFKTKREAAEFLGVGATYLSKMTADKED